MTRNQIGNRFRASYIRAHPEQEEDIKSGKLLIGPFMSHENKNNGKMSWVLPSKVLP